MSGGERADLPSRRGGCFPFDRTQRLLARVSGIFEGASDLTGQGHFGRPNGSRGGASAYPRRASRCGVHLARRSEARRSGDARRATTPRRKLYRRDGYDKVGARGVHRQADRDHQHFCRPGGDRDRECEAVR